MCGIVGAVSKRDIVPFLVEGLRRLEYRGYDSAGAVTLDESGALQRSRTVGKVVELERSIGESGLNGFTGIAHTRWATHGKPTETNAHPHICRNTLALVCNGIVENHEVLRQEQMAAGLSFTSETDTEVIVHQVYSHLSTGLALFEAVRATMDELIGSYAIAVVEAGSPEKLVAARQGPPLLIGIGDDEILIASDMAALLPVTRNYVVLEDGDVAEIDGSSYTITDSSGSVVERAVRESQLAKDAVELGDYRHFMEKEIFEQPRAISDTLEGRLAADHIMEGAFGAEAERVFDRVQEVEIIACGTSFHAGLVAKHWFEHVGVSCHVEVASEYRYRRHVARKGVLAVTISQSGETADTLAALAEAKRVGCLSSLVICNVPESSLIRESELSLLTHAGPEIGVASTKAFTTQLVALMLLAVALSRRHGFDRSFEANIVAQLRSLPKAIEEVLAQAPEIAELSKGFANKHHTLFLGRGVHYPVALEGALKLKEISYIHAEAYPAGELKHGPLALVDEDMPVVAVAPNDELLDKLKSNLKEVQARGGRLLVFAESGSGFVEEEGLQVVPIAQVDSAIAPMIYTVPLQLLAYHVALIKGTDVDKPRNLAKSVTVE